MDAQGATKIVIGAMATFLFPRCPVISRTESTSFAGVLKSKGLIAWFSFFLARLGNLWVTGALSAGVE
jgi:hypothetical protein